MKKRILSHQKVNQVSPERYVDMMKQKSDLEQRINRLKHRYQNKFISGGIYYKQYEKLGEKLIELERNIIRRFPHKSLNPKIESEFGE